MPTKYVRPYSKGQKNNFRDAEAIAEAVQRPALTAPARDAIGNTQAGTKERPHRHEQRSYPR
jgi:hypothetical protein